MTGFIGLPTAGGDKRQVAAVVNRFNLGKLNCAGSVTLAAGQTTTSVQDPRAASGSFVGFMPLTADAAAELAGGTMYVSSRARGSFVITHVNSAQTDRDFAYVIIG